MPKPPELTEEQANTLLTLKLELLHSFLRKHPMRITSIVQLSSEELNLPQHISRTSVDAWVREGKLHQVHRKVKEGPGRPRRIIGGVPGG